MKLSTWLTNSLVIFSTANNNKFHVKEMDHFHKERVSDADRKPGNTNNWPHNQMNMPHTMANLLGGLPFWHKKTS